MTLQSVLNTSDYVLALAWLPAWASNPTGDWCPSYANFGAPDDAGDPLMIRHLDSENAEDRPLINAAGAAGFAKKANL